MTPLRMHRQRNAYKVRLSNILPTHHASRGSYVFLTIPTIHTGFEGATAISSNAYFGRPEDELPEDDYGDLESVAKDMVRKFGVTAGDDLENLTSLIGEGATKLQGAIRNYLNS